MCKEWPGPRCSHDMERKLASRINTLRRMENLHGAHSPEADLAFARVTVAQADYDSTPRGFAELENRIAINPDDADAASRLAAGKLTRTMQTNAFNEVNNGRLESMQEIVNNLNEFMDKEEIGSILESARESRERYALKRAETTDLTVDQSSKYTELIKNLELSLAAKYPGGIPPHLQNHVNRLQDLEAPDPINLAAYSSMPKSIEMSKEGLVREIKNAAALQGTSAKIAAEFYEGYRKQYKDEFAKLPEGERPDVPEQWVRGEFKNSGYAQAAGSTYAPHDPASLYAMYRLRSDEKAIPDFLKRSAAVASIDLETAGPEGPEGFKPTNGHIIEVGIVSYSSKGKEIGRYSKLMRPNQEFLNQYGTGASNGHQIAVKDLEGKPAFQQLAPEISKELEGKTILAQNKGFKDKWLSDKLPGFKETHHNWVDTYEMSAKHMDIPDNKLKTICDNIGVKYADGRRAENEAEVTGEAYFKLKAHIKKTWNSKPARRDAPPLTSTPVNSRWAPKKAALPTAA